MTGWLASCARAASATRGRRSIGRLVLVAACAGSPVAAQDRDPWYFGNYVGKLVEGGDEVSFSLTCNARRVCEIALHHRQMGERSAVLPQVTTEFFDPKVPNRNLARTRSIVEANPALYDDREFGPLLRPIRRLLAGGHSFQSCLRLSDQRLGDFSYCALSPDAGLPARNHLLIGLLDPGCGSRPFCAYYFVPMVADPEEDASAPE